MESNELKLIKRQRILIVIICVLAFTTLVSFVYAFVQQGIAQENTLLAEKNAIEAMKNAEEANRQRLMAEKSAEEAKHQFQRALEASLKQKGNK